MAIICFLALSNCVLETGHYSGQSKLERDWKVSELESVRIGKCQNWKVSELESVRIGKCQNWTVPELESVKVKKV